MATKVKTPRTNHLDTPGAISLSDDREAWASGELAREIARMEAEEGREGNLLAGLRDTPVQRVQTGIVEWNRLDDLRSTAAFRRRVAIQTREKEELKSLGTQLLRIRKQQIVVLKELLTALAEEADVRETVANWLAIRTNLRPILQKHLGLRGIDVSQYVQRATELETEHMAMRNAMDTAVDDTMGPDEDGDEVTEGQA